MEKKRKNEEEIERRKKGDKIGKDIAILLESFDKKTIDGVVTPLLAELAYGVLKGGLLDRILQTFEINFSHISPY